jgi:hypothetical protein
MAVTYMRFHFGSNEDGAQEACRKLDLWKQAFRLDKKLIYKLERKEPDSAGSQPPKTDGKSPKNEDKEKEAGSKRSAKSHAGNAKKSTTENIGEPGNGSVQLLVRLSFSAHEKLSEQQWMQRLPSEEPFREASPVVIKRDNATEFQKASEGFTDLETGPPRK